MPRGAALPALFFLLGLGLFAWLIAGFGPAAIAAHIAGGGWSLLTIVLIWLVIYLLNAAAWKLVLGDAGREIGTGELFLLTVSGFVINYITPVVALGGEPYKVAALSRRMGAQKAISSVVLYRMVHLLGHMALLLAGIAGAFLFVALHPAVAWPLGIAGVVIGGVIFLTLNGTREGVFDRLGRTAERFRFLGFLSGPLGKYRGELAGMDRVLTDTYRTDRRRFALGVALEFAGRVLMGVEVFVILAALGHDVSPAAALHVYVVYSIVINLLFFIPMNVGAREGGVMLGLESVVADPVTGVSVGVIIRIREFIWIAIGLLFILVSSRLRRPPPEGAPQPGG